jgi:hypothetical protein
MTVIGYFDPSLLPIDPAALLFNKDISPFYAFSRGGHFSKPSGLKIVALVPFNNYEHTSILECYLQVRFNPIYSSLQESSPNQFAEKLNS